MKICALITLSKENVICTIYINKTNSNKKLYLPFLFKINKPDLLKENINDKFKSY